MSKTIIYGLSTNDLKKFATIAVDEYRKTTHVENSQLNSEEDKLTQKQAANFLGKSVTTIIEWKKKGKIPYYQIGRSIFFSKSELLKLARKNPELVQARRK